MTSVQEMFGEVVDLERARMIEQVAWVVQEAEVSAAEVVPILLARQEVEGFSADFWLA